MAADDPDFRPGYLSGNEALYLLGFLGFLAIWLGLWAYLWGAVLLGALLFVAMAVFALLLGRHYRRGHRAEEAHMSLLAAAGTACFVAAFLIPIVISETFFADLAGCQLQMTWSAYQCLQSDGNVQVDLALLLVGTSGCAAMGLWCRHRYSIHRQRRDEAEALEQERFAAQRHSLD